MTGQLIFHNLPGILRLDATRYYSYVRQVTIQYTEPVRLTEEVLLKCVVSAWPESIVFPLASHLKIDFGGFLYKNAEYNNILKNRGYELLSQRIQMQMPKLQEVRIIDHGHDFAKHMEAADSRGWKTDGVLSAMFGKIKSFAITRNNVELISTFPSSIANAAELTKLDFNAFTDDNTVLRWIMKMSAPTLETLEYHRAATVKAASFFLDAQDKPIVYPRLQKLQFSGYEYPYPKKGVRVDPSVTPFPVLRYLKWRGPYVFNDDALFRGNNNTLEYLDIDIDTWLASVLKTHDVFADEKYPNLQHIATCRSERLGRSGVFRNGEFEAMAVNLIRPATTVFTYKAARLSCLADSLAACLYLENIRTLCIPDFEGTLRQLLDLVRLLPNMSRLCGHPGSINYATDTVEFKEFVDNYGSTKFPPNHQLRHWDVLTNREYSTKFIAHTALALVVLCPRFEGAYIPGYERGYFEYNIGKAIDSGLFNGHVNRIEQNYKILEDLALNDENTLPWPELRRIIRQRLSQTLESLQAQENGSNEHNSGIAEEGREPAQDVAAEVSNSVSGLPAQTAEPEAELSEESSRKRSKPESSLDTDSGSLSLDSDQREPTLEVEEEPQQKEEEEDAFDTNAALPQSEVPKDILATEADSLVSREIRDLEDRINYCLQSFDEAPFTIQRIAELLVWPERHYRSAMKFLRAIERVVYVTSTVEDFPPTSTKPKESSDGTSNDKDSNDAGDGPAAIEGVSGAAGGVAGQPSSLFSFLASQDT
ncbi:hypothetical protein EV177_007668, partial [Coemansia sp. RSA 1804]